MKNGADGMWTVRGEDRLAMGDMDSSEDDQMIDEIWE